jgi:hypothetical protein
MILHYSDWEYRKNIKTLLFDLNPLSTSAP